MREAVSSDRKAEVVSRWLAGESNEKISTSTSLAAPMIVGIINQWKRELGSALADAYRSAASNPEMVGLQQKEEGTVAASVSPTDVVRAFRMMVVFRTLGLEADEAESLITRFYNLSANTGITPERLANTVMQVLKLAELDGIELHQIPSHVEGLTDLKKQLESDLEDLNKRKKSIEQAIAESIPSKVAEIRQQQKYSNHVEAEFDNMSREKLSELVMMDKSLEERGFSLHDVAEFTKMLDNAKRYGYDFPKIVDLLSNIESVEQTRDELNKELAKLNGKAEILSSTQRAIEDEVSHRQPVIDAITKLSEMGFGLQDFELIYDMIEKIANVHGIDYQTAKTKYLQDMQKEGQRQQEAGVSEGMGGLVFRNLSEGDDQKVPLAQDHESSGVLNMLERLKSNGVSEQTIIKCTIINELFRIDLDSLADELKKYGNLTKVMQRLGETRKTLESEELSLKHKILALEEQRQRVLSLTRELIKQSPTQIAHLPIQSGSEYDELEALVRAANGEKVNPEELLASLTRAIEMICKTLDNNSITRKIMEHAKLSLKREPKT